MVPYCHCHPTSHCSTLFYINSETACTGSSWNTDSLVSAVSRLRAGLPRHRPSIPGKVKRVYIFPILPDRLWNFIQPLIQSLQAAVSLREKRPGREANFRLLLRLRMRGVLLPVPPCDVVIN
jgi:hypothetical protein